MARIWRSLRKHYSQHNSLAVVLWNFYAFLASCNHAVARETCVYSCWKGGWIFLLKVCSSMLLSQLWAMLAEKLSVQHGLFRAAQTGDFLQ